MGERKKKWKHVIEEENSITKPKKKRRNHNTVMLITTIAGFLSFKTIPNHPSRSSHS
jgi:hypothetical protein